MAGPLYSLIPTTSALFPWAVRGPDGVTLARSYAEALDLAVRKTAERAAAEHGLAAVMRAVAQTFAEARP